MFNFALIHKVSVVDFLTTERVKLYHMLTRIFALDFISAFRLATFHSVTSHFTQFIRDTDVDFISRPQCFYSPFFPFSFCLSVCFQGSFVSSSDTVVHWDSHLIVRCGCHTSSCPLPPRSVCCLISRYFCGLFIFSFPSRVLFFSFSEALFFLFNVCDA